MHITTKGQVTIPQEIREQFGFLPHSEVTFQVEKGKVYLIKSCRDKPQRGQILLRNMRGKGDVNMSTNEILDLTRK